MNNFDEPGWRLKLEEIATHAGERCGQSHDVFVESLSHAVDRAASGFFDQDKLTALSIATEFGYASPSDRALSQALNLENGYCTHGIAMGCCPVGCDFPDDPDHD